jgi:hypothetical protein
MASPLGNLVTLSDGALVTRLARDEHSSARLLRTLAAQPRGWESHAPDPELAATYARLCSDVALGKRPDDAHDALVAAGCDNVPTLMDIAAVYDEEDGRCDHQDQSAGGGG